MKTINKNTKLGKYFYRSYNHPCGTDIQAVYKKPSDAKVSADERCRQQCYNESSRDYKIISAGRQTFSVAWLLEDGSLRVETHHNSYIIK